MAMKFIQMADPQFGMFASISKLTKEEAADRSREGFVVFGLSRKTNPPSSPFVKKIYAAFLIITS